jgi:hypothetical protein
MAAVFRCRSVISSDRIAEAAPYAVRAFALLTEAGDRPRIAFALFFLALNAQFTGDLEAACELHEQCATLCLELGFESLGAGGLPPLCIARLELEDPAAARAELRQGLPASVAAAGRFIIPIGLWVPPGWPRPVSTAWRPLAGSPSCRSGYWPPGSRRVPGGRLGGARRACGGPAAGHPDGMLPPGGRRAGLLAHACRPQLIGLANRMAGPRGRRHCDQRPSHAQGLRGATPQETAAGIQLAVRQVRAVAGPPPRHRSQAGTARRGEELPPGNSLNLARPSQPSATNP